MDYNDDGRLIVVGSKSGQIGFFDAKTLKLEKQVNTGSDAIVHDRPIAWWQEVYRE